MCAPLGLAWPQGGQAATRISGLSYLCYHRHCARKPFASTRFCHYSCSTTTHLGCLKCCPTAVAEASQSSARKWCCNSRRSTTAPHQSRDDASFLGNQDLRLRCSPMAYWYCGRWSCQLRWRMGEDAKMLPESACLEVWRRGQMVSSQVIRQDRCEAPSEANRCPHFFSASRTIPFTNRTGYWW